ERRLEARVLPPQLLAGALEPQAPVHAVGDRGKDQEREQAGDDVVGAPLGADRGEDLAGRTADRDDERIVLERAIDQEPRDLILEPALGVEPAGRLLLEQLEQPGALEAAAGLLANVAAGGADHAVEADHADEAIGADLHRVVEAGEV